MAILQLLALLQIPATIVSSEFLTPMSFYASFSYGCLATPFVAALHNKVYELPHVVPLHLYYLWV
jgi:hypothetical protein